MEWVKNNWRIVAILVTAALLFLWLMQPQTASAADLGGGCCADLEERIAELESTAARKGNRKVSVRVYGQVNKAIMHVSGDGDADTAVIENSNAETFIGVAGEARISPSVRAGYVIEIGLGEHRELLSPDDANGIYVKRSFAYVESKDLGALSVGLREQATKGVTQHTAANTAVAARMLSLRPLVGAQTGEAADIFDGGRTNLIRYDSPTFYGAVLSASWANGDDTFPSDGADVWDVALAWYGEGQGLKVSAGVGYRKGIVVPDLGNFANTPAGDLTTLSGSLGVLHIDSGLFASAAYGRLDYGAGTINAYHAQAGIERKLSELGKTTFFGEYARTSDNLDVSLWGGGVVQAIEAAALDLYVSGRRLDLGGDTADVIMAGARVQF